MGELLKAYNSKTGDSIYFTIPELPENLFNASTGKYRAFVKFKDDVYWLMDISPPRPLEDAVTLSLEISILKAYDSEFDKLSEYTNSTDNFSIFVSYDEKTFRFHKRNNGRLNVNDIPLEYDVAIGLKPLAKKLIERQLIQL
jgi:hypothetical protein